MVIMSIDYGDSKTGLAICDKYETLAFPLGVIKETDMASLTEKVAVIAAENFARMIVIGYPKNMDGSEGFKAQAIKSL